jgi:hypothetical protein
VKGNSFAGGSDPFERRRVVPDSLGRGDVEDGFVRLPSLPKIARIQESFTISRAAHEKTDGSLLQANVAEFILPDRGDFCGEFCRPRSGFPDTGRLFLATTR